ncbi:hypothetical protein SLA2020_091280 [Shorea laevis]
MWDEAQKNFDKFAKDGFLYRIDFAQYIGMMDSKEFALELFDALKHYKYWSQITDQSFDSRLQIFYDCSRL